MLVRPRITPRKLNVSPRALEINPTPEGIGLVVPFDFAIEDEYWRWLPPNIPLFTTRTPHPEHTAVTIDLANEISDSATITTAVKSLKAVRPAVVGYACTSGSFVRGMAGERALHNIIVSAGAPAAVTTSGALLQALSHLGVRRLAVATPYNRQLTLLLADYLAEAGFEVVSSGYLDREEGIARIGYDDVRRLAESVDHPEAEAIFFSCTNLRTFDIIEELEARHRKPILSANQVTMWAVLINGGIPLPQLPQQLFTAP